MSDFFGENLFFSFGIIEILLKSFNMVKIDRSSGGESRFLTNLTKFLFQMIQSRVAMFTEKRLFLDIWEIGCNSLIYDYHSIKKNCYSISKYLLYECHNIYYKINKQIFKKKIVKIEFFFGEISVSNPLTKNIIK